MEPPRPPAVRLRALASPPVVSSQDFPPVSRVPPYLVPASRPTGRKILTPAGAEHVPRALRMASVSARQALAVISTLVYR